MKEKIIEELKRTLKKTGYVSEINIFEGEFYEDSRKNRSPYVSYVLSLIDKKRDTKLHRLEREIRYGFYDDGYSECNIKTLIEPISLTEEKHTLTLNFNHDLYEKRQRQLYKAANHLIRIINEYHFKHKEN